VSRYKKGKTNLYFTEARDSEWHWHQLGHMQVCTSLQTDNHASAPLLFFTGQMPFLPPNQQRQSTEGMLDTDSWVEITTSSCKKSSTNLQSHKFSSRTDKGGGSEKIWMTQIHREIKLNSCYMKLVLVAVVAVRT